MLKLKHHITLPKILSTHQPVFAKISDDDDELIQAIEASDDDHWQLTPAPDSEQLEDYWSSVVDDIHADPEWHFDDQGHQKAA